MLRLNIAYEDGAVYDYPIREDQSVRFDALSERIEVSTVDAWGGSKVVESFCAEPSVEVRIKHVYITNPYVNGFNRFKIFERGGYRVVKKGAV